MRDSGLGTVFDITEGVAWVAEQHQNGTRRSVANMRFFSFSFFIFIFSFGVCSLLFIY